MKVAKLWMWTIVLAALLGGAAPAFGDVAPPNQKPKKSGCAMVTGPSSATTSAVPLGLAALLILRRRRKARRHQSC